MKQFISDIWQKPVTVGLYNHMRNDIRLSEDRKKIFDAITTKSGDNDFFIDETGIERKRYFRLYNDLAACVLNELIRLAEIGYQTENIIKNQHE